ncbi:MAG: rRNA maturation RNase YbeY [Patescibacteria group bacterium]
MIRIAFFFETAPTHRLFKSHVRNVLHKAARLTRLSDVDIDVIVVGDARMKKLNTTYRGKRTPTDVLSFALRDGVRFPQAKKTREHLGDIFINYSDARRRARDVGVPVKDIFAFLAVHGFLHLAGFDHRTPREIRRMRLFEQTICRGKVFYNHS